MDLNEVARDWIRVERAGTRVRVLVQTIEWDGPHTPISRWVAWKEPIEAARLPPLEAVAASIARDRRSFRTCGTCGELNPRGRLPVGPLEGDSLGPCRHSKHRPHSYSIDSRSFNNRLSF
jgi:hypothetical protein